MGDGFAVQPTQDDVYAPVSGTITTVFETKHAIGIETDSGAEILVHMGLDTVELNGAPFKVLINIGDKVTPDTKIAQMNREAVQAAGKATDIVVALTNADKVNTLTISKSGDIQAKAQIGEAEIK